MAMKSLIFRYRPIIFGLSLILSIITARVIAYHFFGEVGERVVSNGVLVLVLVYLLVGAQYLWSDMNRTSAR